MTIPKEIWVFIALLFFTTAGYGRQDLSKSCRANCYIVTSGSDYSLNATFKGESLERITGGVSAMLVWSDKARLISDVRLEGDHIFFTASGGQGNAVVAVCSAQNEILWSWHIWCRSKQPSDELYLNYNIARFAVMDAFLGSDDSGNVTTLYQWGRKDPFPVTDKVFVGSEAAEEIGFLNRFPVGQPVAWSGNGIADHPARFIAGDRFGNWFTNTDNAVRSLWGDFGGFHLNYMSGGWTSPKSIHDPCPAGYRVASRYAFSNFMLNGENTDKIYEFNVVGPWENGYRFQKRGGDDAGTWYPATLVRDPQSGEVKETASGHVWCSHPHDLHRKSFARLSYAPQSVQGVDQYGSAAGHAVRCVKIDDMQLLSSREGEALWRNPVLTAPAAPPVNLSDGATANCYIVYGKGNYRINAKVKGNSNLRVGKAASAELLWCDVPCLIGNVKLDPDGFIGFSVHRMAGNGVIAVKSAGGEILWSWHIWVSCEPVREIVMHNHENIPSTMLDRAIGAYSANGGFYCMLYQWGRKDPFPNQDVVFAGANSISRRRFSDAFPAVKSSQTGDANRNNMNFVVRNPAVYILSDTENGSWMPHYDSTIPYLWGDPAGFAAAHRSTGRWSDKKSIYDPCPAGYRVSNSGSFTGMTSTGQATTDASKFRTARPFDGGWFIRCNPGDTQGNWFPLSGWRVKETGLPGATDSRGAFWHSNPTGTGSEKMRRTMYALDNVMPESSETMANGYAVRCVKEK